ncbi:MAG: hypothetical protein IKB88_02190 [Clostridia bacterium]|nr:hypothetical protein [Clostridia bacterium]
MNARIINNVEESPNIYEYKGIKLNLQLGMWSFARIKEKFAGGMKEVLTRISEDDVFFFVLATLIDEAFIVKAYEEGKEYPQADIEYLKAKTSLKNFPEATRIVGRAMGLSIGTTDSEQAEIDKEIDEALDEEDIEDADEKNLKAEQTAP